MDYTKFVFGENAIHVPAWMYVQGGGDDGVVSFVGASHLPALGAAHPLRYGSDRTHQLIVGEMVVRPHLVVGTDAHRGAGLAALISSARYDRETLLANGEVVINLGLVDLP